MAAPTTTLADVLIEAGFEPEMARRVTEVIEQDLTGLARQAELDIRLDKIDDRFDRFEVEINGRFDVIDARLDGVDRDIKALNTRIDDLNESVGKEFRATNQRIDDLREEFIGRHDDLKTSQERSLAAHKESVDRSLADQTTSIERLLAAQKESQDRSLNDHKESIERLLAAQKESQDRSLNDHKKSQASDSRVIKWALGILAAAVLGGGAAVIALLIELFSRLP